jgi:hypothetical protein
VAKRVLFFQQNVTRAELREFVNYKTGQALVGGLIDRIEVEMAPGKVYDVWINDEGKINGMKPNRRISPYHFVNGPFYVAKCSEGGRTLGLDDEDVAIVKAYFDKQTQYLEFVDPGEPKCEK